MGAPVGVDGQPAPGRGRARWAQSCRSQIRQPSPMRVAERGSSRAMPSAYTRRWAWRSSQPSATAKSARGARCPNPPRVTVLATQKYLLPSGISATWVRMRPGAENASYTVQSGQVPPSREKWKSLADCRLEMFPARSTRRNENGTPRSPVRWRVESRWQTVSKPTPKRAWSSSMS